MERPFHEIVSNSILYYEERDFSILFAIVNTQFQSWSTDFTDYITSDFVPLGIVMLLMQPEADIERKKNFETNLKYFLWKAGLYAPPTDEEIVVEYSPGDKKYSSYKDFREGANELFESFFKDDIELKVEDNFTSHFNCRCHIDPLPNTVEEYMFTRRDLYGWRDEMMSKFDDSPRSSAQAFIPPA